MKLFWAAAGKPTLQGRKLLENVRRAMQIPYPSGKCECIGRDCYCPANGLLIMDDAAWDELAAQKKAEAPPHPKGQLSLF